MISTIIRRSYRVPCALMSPLGNCKGSILCHWVSDIRGFFIFFFFFEHVRCNHWHARASYCFANKRKIDRSSSRKELALLAVLHAVVLLVIEQWFWGIGLREVGADRLIAVRSLLSISETINCGNCYWNAKKFEGQIVYLFSITKILFWIFQWSLNIFCME